MSVLHKLQNLQQILGQSPIVSLSKSISNSGELAKQLQLFRRETEILLEKCYNPLKIVLLGEVKAGKSTLLNVFAGDAVSPTNVTETTASIIEIKHASQRNGSIVNKNGDYINGSPEEIYEILGENRGNQEYFSNVSVVKLEFPLSNLQKVHLVDTPGLATVTSNNEQTTLDYIQNSDVVLWVFSAHHLGQWDIEEQLANVKSYGKPIIAVVNRLDEINGTVEEIESYIEDRLGFFVEEVFAVSAYQAFEGMRTGDEELLINSRYPELLSFLEENIEKQDQEVQQQSLKGSIKALAEKERIQHQIVGDTVTFLLQSMDRRKEEIKYHNDTIKKKMKMELNNWMLTHFLDEEKRELMREVDGLSMISGKTSYDAISTKLNQYVSSEYIIELLEKKFADINNLFHQEWNEAIHTIGEKISMEEDDFKKNQVNLYKDNDVSLNIYLPIGENAVADGAIKGAAIGGAYGIAAATYTAVLGPSAAAVTMGAALGAVLAPALIVGAVTGIAAKLVFGNKKKKEFKMEIIKAFDETKQQVSGVFLPTMVDQLEKKSNQTANDLYEKLCSFMSQGWTEKELIDLQQKIKVYNSTLKTWEQGIKDEQLV